MAHKPDVPCAGGCGRLLWRGPGSLPEGKRMCRQCRAEALAAEKAAGETSSSAPASTPADGFGERGRRLWRDLKGATLPPADRLLLEEACRLADRLDRLDAFLVGQEDAWLRFRARNEDGSVVRVVVDRALSEARQQADTLRGIVADLNRKLGAGAPETPEVNPLDEFTRRREERRRAAGL